MMIFCNNKENCVLLHNYLREHRVDKLGVLHGGMKGDDRQKILLALKLKDIKYLICTDIASRGIDIKGINHVVMYDFPRSSIEYLHRAGRTARAGFGGKVTSLIDKKDGHIARYIKVSILFILTRLMQCFIVDCQ